MKHEIDTTDMLHFLDNFSQLWDSAQTGARLCGSDTSANMDRLSDMLQSYCRAAGLPADMCADDIAMALRDGADPADLGKRLAVCPDWMESRSTGGGCTAWNFRIGNASAYVLLTDEDGSAPRYVENPVCVGLYDSDGNQVIWWDCDTIQDALIICRQLSIAQS